MDKDKFIEILSEYKNKFDIRWPEEKYKWQNIKQFQDNWDIDAENFVEMLEKAIPATNLLVSRNYFPRGMIIAFANNDPEKVRSMFMVFRTLLKSVFAILNRYVWLCV